jgi:hypothetical protein
MFNVSAQVDGRYVLIVASGPAAVPELCAAISFLSELLERSGRRRALIDIMGLAFVLDGPGDQAVLEHLVDRLPALEKLGIVVPARTSHGLMAKAARAKGIDVGEFDNLPAADSWLCD